MAVDRIRFDILCPDRDLCSNLWALDHVDMDRDHYLAISGGKRATK